jgi:hypothetical protein
MALPLVIWVGAFAVITRGFRAGLLLTVPPALLYAIWYLLEGRHGVLQASRPDVTQLRDFVWHGLDQIWSAATGFHDVGVAMLVVLTLVALGARDAGSARALALSGLATTLVTYGLLGFGRAGLGEQAAGAGRYLYFGVLFTLPALALGFSVVSRRMSDLPGQRVAVGAVVMGLFAFSGCADAVAYRDNRNDVVGDLPLLVAASVELIGSGETLLSDAVEPHYSPNIRVEALREKSIQRALPAIHPGPQARLDAKGALQVAVSSDQLPVPQATALAAQHGLEVSARGSCLVGDADDGAYVVLRTEQAGVQFLLASQGPSVRTVLTAPSGRRSAASTYLVDAQQPMWVGTSADEGRLTVSVPRGPVRLCLAEPDVEGSSRP